MVICGKDDNLLQRKVLVLIHRWQQWTRSAKCENYRGGELERAKQNDMQATQAGGKSFLNRQTC